MVTSKTVNILKMADKIKARIRQICFKSKVKMFSIQITAKTQAAARAAHIQEVIHIKKLVPIKWRRSSITRMVENTMWLFFRSKFHILRLDSTQTSRIRNSIMKKTGLGVCYKRARISHLVKISLKNKISTKSGLHRKMLRTQTATKTW